MRSQERHIILGSCLLALLRGIAAGQSVQCPNPLPNAGNQANTPPQLQLAFSCTISVDPGRRTGTVLPEQCLLSLTYRNGPQNFRSIRSEFAILAESRAQRLSNILSYPEQSLQVLATGGLELGKLVRVLRYWQTAELVALKDGYPVEPLEALRIATLVERAADAACVMRKRLERMDATDSAKNWQYMDIVSAIRQTTELTELAVVFLRAFSVGHDYRTKLYHKRAQLVECFDSIEAIDARFPDVFSALGVVPRIGPSSLKGNR